MIRIFLLTGLLASTLAGYSQQTPTWKGKFEQLDQTLPTPNSYRTGSGAPGPSYWQQRADYVISAEVDDNTQLLTGSETITYYNNSPEALNYLWMQLDQNLFAENSLTQQTRTNAVRDSIPSKFFAMGIGINSKEYKGGYTIKSVTDATGKALAHTINYTMMRVDLPAPLKSGEKFIFNVSWSFTEKDRNEMEDRG